MPETEPLEIGERSDGRAGDAACGDAQVALLAEITLALLRDPPRSLTAVSVGVERDAVVLNGLVADQAASDAIGRVVERCLVGGTLINHLATGAGRSLVAREGAAAAALMPPATGRDGEKMR
jgi:hypothetical protein